MTNFDLLTAALLSNMGSVRWLMTYWMKFDDLIDIGVMTDIF
jgi:hypothetical protein